MFPCRHSLGVTESKLALLTVQQVNKSTVSQGTEARNMTLFRELASLDSVTSLGGLSPHKTLPQASHEENIIKISFEEYLTKYLISNLPNHEGH